MTAPVLHSHLLGCRNVCSGSSPMLRTASLAHHALAKRRWLAWQTAVPACTAVYTVAAAINNRCSRLHPSPCQRPAVASAALSSTASPAPARVHQAVKRVKQPVDFTTLAALCEELRQQWVPAKVEEVVQPDKYTLALRLRTLSSQAWLHLCWHPTTARVCIGQQPSRGAASEAFSFAEQCSQQLKGLVLSDARMPQPWERVVQLSFGTRPGEPPSRKVYCEVMARYSNVILAEAADEILLCAHQVGGKMSSLRLVQQGRTYSLPPVVSGIPPDTCQSLEDWQKAVVGAAQLLMHAAEQGGGSRSTSAASDDNAPSAGRVAGQRVPMIADACVRAFNGASPSLLEELCAAAGISTLKHVADMHHVQWAALYEQWERWLQALADKRFAASIDESTGRMSMLGSYSRTYSSTHELLDDYYSQLQGTELHAQLHQKLSAAVAGCLKKARNKIFAFNKQLQESQRAEQVQLQGDLIIANVYRIAPGAASVEVDDWETGQPLLLQLDPEQTAVEQAEALFKKARKLRRASEAVAPLLAASQSELAYLEEVEASVQLLGTYREPADLRSLSEVQEELVEAGLLKAPSEAVLAAKGAAKGKKAQRKAGGKQGRGAQAQSSTASFRQYVSPSGMQVLVGRNNKQNDVLSHQVANPQDLWMHVQGMPGSHTVLRIPAGKEASEDDIQFAADLAAFFSKGRHEGKAAVIVTKAANLKKPKGAKPGQVLVTKGESVVIARPASSLAARQGEQD